MIRFVRDAGIYKRNMERELGPLEAGLIASGDAVQVAIPDSRPISSDAVKWRFDPATQLPVGAQGLGGLSMSLADSAAIERITTVTGVPFTEGSDGADVTTAFLAACAIANVLDVPLLLPPWPILISQTPFVNRMIGTPGKSKIILAPNFTKTGYNSQFCFLNSSFSRGYNPSTANFIWYEGFDVETTPNSSRSIFGLANVKGGAFEGVNIRVNQVLNPSSKPYVADALIDLYACVKNVRIQRCTLENLTGGWGTTKITEGGGGCIWIRNFRSSPSADSVTENNTVFDNTIRHQTSDEAIAIFGVLGVTRNNRISSNRIFGLETLLGAYQPTLVSVFPLNGSAIDATLGPTAAVYDNVVECNTIESRSHLYSVIRIGNSPDTSYACRNNKSVGNKVTAFRSSDATLGPKAVWVAAGSPGVDPDVGVKVIRCIEGTAGTAFSGTVSGNESIDDTVVAEGAVSDAAFAGFQKVTNPTAKGALKTVAEYCRVISGGNTEAITRGFYNVLSITGGRVNVTGTGGAQYILEIDQAALTDYIMTGVTAHSASRWVGIGGALPDGTTVSITNNTGSMNSAGVGAIANGASAKVVVKAHNNVVKGVMSGMSSGSAVTKSGNSWGANAGNLWVPTND